MLEQSGESDVVKTNLILENQFDVQSLRASFDAQGLSVRYGAQWDFLWRNSTPRIK